MAPRKGKKNQGGAGDDGGHAGEKRKTPYRAEPNDNYAANMKKVFSERMFILKVTDSGEYDDLARTFSIKGSSGSTYTVKISNNLKGSCSCESAMFRPPTCKHMLYVLTFALKAEEPLRWQHGFLNTELEALFANLETYPLTSAQVSSDPSLTDGTPKSVNMDCPVCYKTCGDNTDVTVCCTSCGHYAHKICFDVRGEASSG
ncbi:hypothetical protein CONLIGDRAFT_632635 [Coniochaeta ligniaria NRRL 30616]|uniref:SWIM-type domain-containing protein n=1 Tax=Coniochaeta ligniaria NRRL 30616 TaxID=1408157 RepID=A0A1J7IM94_9PEZI|nr:hypothetical protein CONLIGDRAFT_632635 [Coniochaeta ligniaria NRRL 30616]